MIDMDEVKITINEYTSDLVVKVNGEIVYEDKSWMINYLTMIEILEKMTLDMNIEWV